MAALAVSKSKGSPSSEILRRLNWMFFFFSFSSKYVNITLVLAFEFSCSSLVLIGGLIQVSLFAQIDFFFFWRLLNKEGSSTTWNHMLS